MSEQLQFTGIGSLARILDYVRENRYRKVLIVHGKNSYRSSGAAAVLDRLECEVRHIDEVKTNPDIDTVHAAATVYRDYAPDCVIAVGGGSVIDTTKAMIASAVQPEDEAFLASRFDAHLDRPVFIAVPTTAGSGSEATHFAVVYVGSKKYSVAHQRLRPDVAVLDPVLSTSCSRDLTLAAGADALCQGIESWWAKGHSETSRVFSMRAVPVVRDTLFRVIEDPADITLREALLTAAHEAGNAINISKTTAGHALSYGLTSTFGVPHGLAVLSVMQVLVREMEATGELPPGIDGLAPTETGEPFSLWFDAFCDQLWDRRPIGDYIGELTVQQINEISRELAGGVNIERLSNHPSQLTADRITGIYRALLERHREAGE